MEEVNKLQLYFDYFVEHHNPKASWWYHTLTEALQLEVIVSG